MLYVLVSAPWYGSTTLAWTAALPIVTGVVGVLAFWATYFPPKGRLLRSILIAESLFSAHSKTPELKVVYRDKEIDDPYRITIRLASRGRKDIEFHKEQPMILDVGTRIIDILKCSFSDGAPVLDALIDDTKLKIGPGPSHMIRKGETIKLTILTEGPAGDLRCQLPFVDVIDRVPDNREPQWIRRLGLGVFAGVILVLFLYALKSRPAVTARPLFAFLVLTELVVYIPGIIAIKWRRRLDMRD